MKPVKEFLNKIKWDKRENPSDYEILCFDRVSRRLIKIPFTSIKKIEGSFMVVEKDGKDVEIPLHRIREFRKKGRVVWKRRYSHA